MFIHEFGLGVNQLCQIVEPATEQREHSRLVVPSNAPPPIGVELATDSLARAGAPGDAGAKAKKSDGVAYRG